MITVDTGKVYSIDELLCLAEKAIENQEYCVARFFLDRTLHSNRGKLQYCRFFLTHAPKGMTGAKRISEIETMLLYVERNGTPEEAKDACTLLAGFYNYLKGRPLRSLGFMLRAGRLNGDDEESLMRTAQRKLTNMEVSELTTDPFGGYLCGFECSAFANKTMIDWAQRFLVATVESKVVPWAGLAAMVMADLLHGKQEAAEFRRYSTAYGNPEILT